MRDTVLNVIIRVNEHQHKNQRKLFAFECETTFYYARSNLLNVPGEAGTLFLAAVS